MLERGAWTHAQYPKINLLGEEEWEVKPGLMVALLIWVAVWPLAQLDGSVMLGPYPDRGTCEARMGMFEHAFHAHDGHCIATDIEPPIPSPR